MYSEQLGKSPLRTGHADARALARASACPSDGGLLDKIANNSATPSSTAFLGAPVDQSTGEILPRWDPIRKWVLQASAKTTLQKHRIHSCMRGIRPDVGHVEVRQSPKSGNCYYTGLMTCASVWACPVCATKIQKVRADELRSAIAAAGSQGLQVAMLTLTIPHTRHDSLQDLVRGFTAALGALTAGRAYKTELRPTFGIAGYVRALEVTWGEANGWHPHAHILLFVDQASDLVLLADMLFPYWETAVKNRGLGQINRAAFSLQSATQAHRYVAKLGAGLDWGPAEELVRGHTKSAGAERYSPFDLLGELAFGEHDLAARGRFSWLFREYAAAFHGRRQLQWSQGLKRQLLGSEGLSDQDIADSLGEVGALLARIEPPDWYLVARYRRQGELLLVANLHGWSGIEHLLESLRAQHAV